MKKLLFDKDWEHFPGHIIKVGQLAEVANRKANELIENGTAREVIELELPADFPGRKHLITAGFNSLEKVSAIKDFDEIEGIGEITEKKIIEYLLK